METLLYLLNKDLANLTGQYVNPYIDAINVEYKSKIYTVHTCPDRIVKGDARVSNLNPDCLITIDKDDPNLIWVVAQWRCEIDDLCWNKIPYMSNIYKFNLITLDKPTLSGILPAMLREKQYNYKNHGACCCIECRNNKLKGF